MAETPDPLTEFAKGFADFRANTRHPGQIEFPIEVAAVETVAGSASADPVGQWCSIRPVGDPKSYLGIYLGDLTIEIDHYYHVKDKTLTISAHTNPAIFVLDLKRIVWGCESWWGFISTPDELRQISNADVENVWYVRALKELAALGPSSSGEETRPTGLQGK